MKIKEYLDKYGIRYSFFARQLGIAPTYFNDVIHGKQALPKKYWVAAMEISEGKITLEDLAEIDKERKIYANKSKKQTPIQDECRDSGELSEIQDKGSPWYPDDSWDFSCISTRFGFGPEGDPLPSKEQEDLYTVPE